jgi:hypothetical protein
MNVKLVSVGQEVTLGGYPDEWILVDRAEGERLRLRRGYGSPIHLSAGFWINAADVRDVRTSDQGPRVLD